ncbi:MAG: hypothetical protein QW733_02685 [Desulfurococcaceae archaeon]
MKTYWVNASMYKRKEEARVIAYGMCKDYAVFATYRKNFLEELHITSRALVLDFTRYIESALRTYHELTYAVPCTESKYTQSIRGLKVLEGGDYLLLMREYCRLITQILCILCRRGLINPPNTGSTVETSNKCGVLGGDDWLTSYALNAGD